MHININFDFNINFSESLNKYYIYRYMSSSLVELLKVKNPPKLLKQVRVVMPREDVVIKTKIIDKTKLAFDRGKFLEGIVGIQKLTQKDEVASVRPVAEAPPEIAEPVASPKPKKRKMKMKLKPKKHQEKRLKKKFLVNWCRKKT